MSNNRPRRAGPVWLWALVLLVILVTLFVLLRRDAAAQEADGYRQSYTFINKYRVRVTDARRVTGELQISRHQPGRIDVPAHAPGGFAYPNRPALPGA